MQTVDARRPLSLNGAVRALFRFLFRSDATVRTASPADDAQAALSPRDRADIGIAAEPPRRILRLDHETR